MRNFKKILLIVVLVILLFVLTACGEDEDSNKKENKDKTSNSENVNNSSNTENNNNEVGNLLNNNTSNGTENTNNSQESSNMKPQEFVSSLKNLDSNKILENAEKQLSEPKEGDTIAIFHIKDYGDIKVKFFEDVAPKACENFIKHAQEGYYNGVIFHRVIEEFMIQGGDPLGTGYGGETIWGEYIGEELNPSILPYRGALCMASGGAGTKSIGSQFFIVQASAYPQEEEMLQYAGLGNILESYRKNQGSLYNLIAYGQYTTFGQVIDGMDIVDKIAKVQTNASDKPLQDVVISSIEITEYKK